MKLKTIYDLLNEISPFYLQEEWDNSGLNVGEFESKIKKIYISLDLDEKIIEEVEENSLIITHHPLIFKSIKKVIPNKFSTKLLFKIIQKNISHIAMHTNFDKTHLNEFFAKEILEFEGESEDFIFYANINMEFLELVEYVKRKMNLNYLRVVKAKDKIKKIAITTGAGMSLLDVVKADCFLTGDIKYHEAMDAKVRKINLIDITHYHSEKYFVDCLESILKDRIDIEVVKLNLDDPFNLI